MQTDEFRNLALAELDSVYRLAYQLAPRPDQADDFVQETYLRAFKYGTQIVLGPHGIRPYLFKILHNVIHTRVAGERRQAVSVDDETLINAPGIEVNEQCDDLSHINWEKIDERLMRAIAELPLPHRTVFLLCAVEGLRYREIADVVEVPVGTVMSRLHRARQVLAVQLAGLGEELGLKKRQNESSIRKSDQESGSNQQL